MHEVCFGDATLGDCCTKATHWFEVEYCGGVTVREVLFGDVTLGDCLTKRGAPEGSIAR